MGKTFKDDYEAMKYELVVMGINEKIVARRIKQLRQFRQLETSVKGAKVILKFAQQYHLTGDFQQIRNIASVRKTNLWKNFLFLLFVIRFSRNFHQNTYSYVDF